MNEMLYSNGVCKVWPMGRQIFNRECERWTAPSSTSVPASNPIPMKAKEFVAPLPLAAAINAVLHAQDLVKRSDLEPRWKVDADAYANLPRPR